MEPKEGEFREEFVGADDERKLFEQAARPLIEYLAKNHHPHTCVHVTSTSAELLEGQMSLSTDEYLLD